MHRHQVCCFPAGGGTSPFSVPGPGLPGGRPGGLPGGHLGVDFGSRRVYFDPFPGLEVKNSYVASQEFDRRRTQQEALGWTVLADWTGGMVHLSITDADGPVRVKDLHAVVGRATQVADDVEPVFAFNGQTYEAPLDLGPGNWNIRMTAVAEDGTEFVQRVILHVKR